MKMKILTLIAILFSLNGYAQTSGTSALGFGASITDEHLEGVAVNTHEYKLRSYSLGYGVFVSGRDKIGMEIRYGTINDEFKSKSETGGSEMKGENYGGSLSYQHYYPILKTLYVHAGVNAGYNHSTSSEAYYYDYPYMESSIQKQYSAGAFGGFSWFLSKSFAFEVNIISLNTTYTTATGEQETDDGQFIKNSKSTSLNLNTQGVINNLGFKIFLLF